MSDRRSRCAGLTGRPRRWMVCAAVLVALIASGTPAAAYVVEVTTSVSMAGASDGPHFEQAIQSAVDGVVHSTLPHTMRFLERVAPLIDNPLDVTRAERIAPQS